MRKLIALGAVVLLMVLALAAEATPVGLDDAEGQAFPGKRVIEVQGSAAMFDAPLQEPEITSAGDSITVEGAGATFRTPVQEP